MHSTNVMDNEKWWTSVSTTQEFETRDNKMNESVLYERFLKLANSLQTPTTNSLLTIMFIFKL